MAPVEQGHREGPLWKEMWWRQPFSQSSLCVFFQGQDPLQIYFLWEIALERYFPFCDSFIKNHSENFPRDVTIRVTFDLVIDHFVKQLRNHQEAARV